MPIYEYLCKDCRNLFEKILTLAEYDKEPICLPEVRQQECGTGTHGFLCRHFEEKRMRLHSGLNLN